MKNRLWNGKNVKGSSLKHVFFKSVPLLWYLNGTTGNVWVSFQNIVIPMYIFESMGNKVFCYNNQKCISSLSTSSEPS